MSIWAAAFTAAMLRRTNQLEDKPFGRQPVAESHRNTTTSIITVSGSGDFWHRVARLGLH
jgi:hypothetical protein